MESFLFTSVSELIPFCKTVPKGQEGVEAVIARTKIEIQDLKADPMTERVADLVGMVDWSKYKTVLDVGCYGGWLYHVAKPQGYVGIDVWPEAIEAAKSLANADFRCESVWDHEGQYDLVWCTQIVWNGRQKEAFEKLKSLGKHQVLAFIKEEAVFQSRIGEGNLTAWVSL